MNSPAHDNIMATSGKLSSEKKKVKCFASPEDEYVQIKWKALCKSIAFFFFLFSVFKMY